MIFTFFFSEPEVVSHLLEASHWLNEFTYDRKFGGYPSVVDFQHKQNFLKTTWNYLFRSLLQIETED